MPHDADALPTLTSAQKTLIDDLAKHAVAKFASIMSDTVSLVLDPTDDNSALIAGNLITTILMRIIVDASANLAALSLEGSAAFAASDRKTLAALTNKTAIEVAKLVIIAAEKYDERAAAKTEAVKP